MFAAALLPFHAYRIAPLLWSEFTQSVLHGGWQVTKGSYLFAFQLGGYWSGHMTEPVRVSGILEWLMNPVLISLIIVGFYAVSRRKWALAMCVPFVVAGFVSYFKDQNYLHFKNFTLGYFIVPALVGAGLDGMKQWSAVSGQRTNREFAWYLSAAIILILMGLCGTNMIKRINAARRIALRVPANLTEFNSVATELKDGKVFVNGLNYWETLWVLRAADYPQAVLPYRHSSLDYETGSANDPSVRYLLTDTGVNTLFDLWGKRTSERILVDAGQYTLHELKGAKSGSIVQISLGDGFYGVEKDRTDEWTWSDTKCELILDSRKAMKCILELTLFSPRTQSLEFN